jgi:hypothetical protein
MLGSNQIKESYRSIPKEQGEFDESNPYEQFYILQKVGLINQAPTINNQKKMGPGPILYYPHFIGFFLQGIKPEVFSLLRSGSIRFALTSLRFFLTGNSAGDRKRPIQKEGGFNERV